MPIRVAADLAAGSISFGRPYFDSLAVRRVASVFLIYPRLPLRWWVQFSRFRSRGSGLASQSFPKSASAASRRCERGGMLCAMSIPDLPRTAAALETPAASGLRVRRSERCNRERRNSELVERRRA